ncbi:MAG TPA: EamA family transporter [Spirochaetia bacterium]|nr:EamA family transporter [Spirochaetia bacterium]
MLALVLATVSNAAFAIFIRLSQRRGANLTVVGAVNYVTAALFHLVLTAAGHPQFPHWETIAIGGAGGITFSWAYFLLFDSMRRRGVSVTASILGLSVMIPVGFSFLAWGETTTLVQTAGIAIAIVSLPLLSIGPRAASSNQHKDSSGRSILVLAGLFIVNGASLVTARAFHQTGIQNEDAVFLFIVFTSATITTLLVWAAQELRRQRQAAQEPRAAGGQHRGAAAVADLPAVPLLASAVPGIAVGLCNALSNRFIVLSLHTLPGIIVYPFYSAAGLLLTVAFSRIVWKEKISRLEMAGIVLACSSIVLINLV